ncbi:MAG: SDH family Clp fold serine proteinase [Nannocystaceae bacterium]
MPTYSEIGAHLGKLSKEEHFPFLAERLRLSLRTMEASTKRPVVLYAANHRRGGSQNTQVAEKDLEFFMDVLRGLKGEKLDLILNSHGGSPDAADMISTYLRQKFEDIRVYVPVEAMSAATMIACGATSVVMGKHSFLGPIDLQLPFRTSDGVRYCAAQDVLDQFKKVRGDFKKDSKRFWTGPGAEYWPDTLVRCENALSYGKEVAERGLEQVMFRGDPKAKEHAKKIAADLADHQKHRAHGRRLSRTYLRQLGMKIADLEGDDSEQDLVLTIHHLSSHWFEVFPAASKIIQSSHGRVAFDLDLPDGRDRHEMHLQLHRIAQMNLHAEGARAKRKPPRKNIVKKSANKAVKKSARKTAKKSAKKTAKKSAKKSASSN